MHLFGSMLRIGIGFAAACLVAGLTQVLFVLTPSQLIADYSRDTLAIVGLLTLAAATHSAIFASIFALVAVALGEWQCIRDFSFYALTGVAIALAGLLAQYASENAAQPTILNTYALAAYVTTGCAAGLAYWIMAGRFAGQRRIGRGNGGVERNGGSRQDVTASSKTRPNSSPSELRSTSVPSTTARLAAPSV